MLTVYSGLERSRSVSSMRRRNCPPCRRANSQLNTAVRAVPMWRVPVGLGARRTRTGPETFTESLLDRGVWNGTDGARTRNFRRDRAVL